MTKADLIEAIYQLRGGNKGDAARLVDQVIDAMRDALATGDPVMISGFGKFTVRKKTARVGRNPQTGAAVDIAARKVVTFKPSVVLKGVVPPNDPA